MTLTDRDLRLRLWWTALLVLFALSAAGLAVAADRPHDDLSRPELFWRAEAEHGPAIGAAWQRVRSAGAAASQVAVAGRQALERLQSLDNAAVEAQMAAGRDGVDALVASVLDGANPVAVPQSEGWRLSPARQRQLASIEAALAAARAVPGEWSVLAATAVMMSDELQTLLRHDGLVFRATTAARQSQWTDALELLDEAAAELDAAEDARDGLAAQGSVETLTDLLARYRTYDSALHTLYVYLRDGGQQTGAEFDALRGAVDSAQAALPGSDDVLAVIVGESAAPAMTLALVEIERARGEINAALEVAP